MKLEDIAEPYTPTTYSVDGNDNEITENSERKNIDHEMMKKGIYRIQKLRMITLVSISSYIMTKITYI